MKGILYTQSFRNDIYNTGCEPFFRVPPTQFPIQDI